LDCPRGTTLYAAAILRAVLKWCCWAFQDRFQSRLGFFSLPFNFLFLLISPLY
jgi:hypothetical protein